MKDDKILTLHPEEGKRGVNIALAKYDVIKDNLVAVVQDAGAITPTDLFSAMEKRLSGKFDGAIGWYTESVKLDLEARGQITHNRKTREIKLK